MSLTKIQRNVLDQLAKSETGRIQLSCVRGTVKDVKLVTVLSLGKRGLIRYRVSGGWASISRPDLEPDEAGEHLLRADLALVLEAVREVGEAKSHWDYYWAFARTRPDSYYPFAAAVRYGVRKGLLERKPWMEVLM